MRPNDLIKELSITQKSNQFKDFTSKNSLEVHQETYMRGELVRAEDSKKRRQITRIIKNAYEYYNWYTLLLSCTITHKTRSLFELYLWVLFVLDQVLLQFGVGLDVDRSEDGLTFLTIWQSDFLFFFSLDFVFLSFSLTLELFFLRFLLSAPFPHINLFKISPHRIDHPPHLSLIRTRQFMHLQIFLLDEVQPIIPASSKEMRHFLPIFASIDMKDELLPCKLMVAVEGTTGLILIFALLEHSLWSDWL